MTNNLIGVLIRLRQYEVAYMTDVESMFHQVKVPENDRDLLRFLWWPNGDLYKEVEEYQMAVHLFGATSSPSVIRTLPYVRLLMIMQNDSKKLWSVR